MDKGWELEYAGLEEDEVIEAAFEQRLFHRSCFLAGPKLKRATADLRSRGWKAYSPTGDKRQDLSVLLRSDAVICLPGWEESELALLEVELARHLGLPVLAYGDELTEVPVCSPPALLIVQDQTKGMYLVQEMTGRCLYCGEPTTDGSDEHQECWELSAEDALSEEEQQEGR